MCFHTNGINFPSEDLARSRINYVKQYFSNTLSDSRQRIFLDIRISLAASRKIKLKLLADEGNINASRILKMQENHGTFFTVVQIGLNAVAILGGIVGMQRFLRPLQPVRSVHVRRTCRADELYSLLLAGHRDVHPVR